MKKYKKILISIVVLILMILCISFIFKLYRVNKIIELMKKNSDITNYRLESKDFVRTRYKNIILITPTKDSNLNYYYNFSIGKCYIIDNCNKIYFEDDIKETDKDLLNFPLYNYLTKDYSFKNKLKLVFKWKIRKYDSTKLEIITENKDKIIFDEKTGFVVNVNDLEKYSIGINKIKLIEFPELNKYSKKN